MKTMTATLGGGPVENFQKRITLEKTRKVVIELPNGDIYRIRVDIEGFLEIQKDGNETSRIRVEPMYSNQITIH